MTDSKNATAGILWIIFAGLMFVNVTIIVRHLGSDLPAVQAAFIRYVIGLGLLLPVLIKMRWRRIIHQNFKFYFFRGLAHGLSVMLWFYAMARIPIAEVTAIGYATPVFTALGAVLIFKEQVHYRRISAIIFGFIGTLIILRPGFNTISTGSLGQVVASMGFAISYLYAKRLTRTENPSDILVMLTIFCTLTLLPGAIIQWITPQWSDVAWLGLVAVFATVGHYAMTKSFAIAPLSVTQPFSFLQLIWAVLFGYLLFAEIPDIGVICGGLVTVAAVSYLAHREALAARRS